MDGRFGYAPGARCGWCIDGFHDSCVVVVECNAVRPNTTRDSRKTGPYFWLCKCENPACVKDPYCLDCRRRGVELSDWRCVDRKRCRNAREYRLKRLKAKQKGKAA